MPPTEKTQQSKPKTERDLRVVERMGDDVAQRAGFYCCRPHAILPSRGTENSIGYDLYAADDGIILGHRNGQVYTGIGVVIPKGYYGDIKGRSSLAKNHGIDVLGGVIDPDYSGELIVNLANTLDEDFNYKKGQRIAQFIFVRGAVLGDTVTTQRVGGFGSTDEIPTERKVGESSTKSSAPAKNGNPHTSDQTDSVPIKKEMPTTPVGQVSSIMGKSRFPVPRHWLE